MMVFRFSHFWKALLPISDMGDALGERYLAELRRTRKEGISYGGDAAVDAYLLYPAEYGLAALGSLCPGCR